MFIFRKKRVKIGILNSKSHDAERSVIGCTFSDVIFQSIKSGCPNNWTCFKNKPDFFTAELTNVKTTLQDSSIIDLRKLEKNPITWAKRNINCQR